MNHRMNDEFYHIEAAIRVGEYAYARECLRDVLKVNPCAEAWYLAGVVARTPEQRVQYLERALLLDPEHSRAQMALDQAYETRQNKAASASASPLVNWIRGVLGSDAQQDRLW